ncbi:TPA: hypothetical protein JAN60_07515 [Legionella pneumophila]|uniref:hypothetical protein n=1 Tax=Legionella pneumophila TaxID=446 RepID=UPI0010A9D16E|nr:hypothetical protein [Legionella pneumophila]TIG67082.1 hypothetical protein DI132_04220 [Legionella pneumophila]TIG72981.1 hypothetical protein DI104_05730 [Legionella pneumophila]HAT3863336.1 hypothetical protein [Legionella pneumophila]HAT3872669.1 hypothetical protein [Legionella pneumophila]HAT7047771.1 hypothetical protein [Legionella pneumophila]
MSLKYHLCLIVGILLTSNTFAVPPVEVISSCKKGNADGPTVTFTKLEGPYASTEEEGCDDHIETTEAGLTYGGISCGTTSFFIINGTRLDSNNAVNNSINPAITPNNRIPYTGRWSKIEFDNKAYLCLVMALSDSGTGAGIPSYYIVENAYSTVDTPILYFYFFDKDVMPMTMTP